MNTLHDLRPMSIWQGQLHDIYVKIAKWPNPCVRIDSSKHLKFNWNYYCFLFERSVKPELWPAIWLDDKIAAWGVTHDYYSAPFNDADWHGGVTFYKKHDNIPGRRSIEIGCDYAHLWDYERGIDYTLEEVFADCANTAQLLSEKFLIHT